MGKHMPICDNISNTRTLWHGHSHLGIISIESILSLSIQSMRREIHKDDMVLVHILAIVPDSAETRE
jgi:hypothetical protein